MRSTFGFRHKTNHALAIAALLTSTAATLALAPQAAMAQSANARAFDIPAQSLPDAIILFGRQAGIEVTAESANTRGRGTQGINGRMAPAVALSRLLSGTGLTFRFVSERSVVIEPAPQASGNAIQLGAVQVSGESGAPALPASLTSDPNATEGSASYTIRQTGGATRLALSPRETPQSMTVVTRQQLDDQQLLSVTDALRVVPGIALSHDDSERHFLYSRGFTTTIVMIDGLRSYDQDASSSFLTQVDTATLDRVEVVRGANGLLKGVGNPSAAINLVHKRATDTFQGHASASVGSWDRYRAEMDLSGPLNQEGTLRARGVADYESRNSFVRAYHKEAYTLYGTLEYDLTPQTLVSASIDFQNNNTDGSTYGANPLFWSDGSRMIVDRSFNVASRGSHVKSQNRKVFVDLTHHFSPDWQLRVRLTDSHTMRDVLVREIYAAAPPNKTTGAATLYDTTFNPKREARGADVMLNGHVDLGGWDADVVAGAAYTRGVLTRTDKTKFDVTNVYTWDTNIAPLQDWSGASISARRTSERETSLYGTARLHPVQGLSVILGTNFETYKLDDIVNGKVNSAPRENGRFVPYAGVVYDVTRQLSLYGSYTNIFSPATVYDANDKLLNPVSGNNFEAGIKGAFLDGKLNASIAGFYIKQNNVAVVMSGVVTPLGQQAYQSTNGVTSKGLEAEIAGEILPGWQVQGGVTYLHARTAAGARVNTGMPQNQAKFATSYRFDDGRLKGLMIGANATWQDSTYYVTSFGTASQNNVAVVGLIGGYEINRHLSASMVLNNLFNKTYYDGYGLYTSYTYGTPRDVLFTLRYKL